MKCAIVVPVINEKDNLEKLIPAIFYIMTDCMILIVDDNSQDGTKGLLDKFIKENKKIHHIIRRNDLGYGKSISAGLNWCFNNGFDNVVTMDADFSHDPSLLPKMIEKLDENDLVIGSRYIRGGGTLNWGIHRKILSRFANWYVRFILQVPFHDGTAGFVAYNRKALTAVQLRGSSGQGYAFLVETKYNIANAGLKIGEIPIIFKDRTNGNSKMSWKIIWESIWLPWRLRFSKNKDND